MAQDSYLLDARNNPFAGSVDGVGNETFTDARVASATLGALNAEIIMDIQGKAVARFDVRTAAGALTLVFEGTLDGTNYFTLPAFAEQQTIVAALTAEQFVPSIISTAAMNGIYAVVVKGYRRVRARVSAYTSGNITVTARASVADEIIYARQIPSTLHVTATAAANTAVTATLPAAGVGLFHYITHIHITRNSTAILAGTATLIHTTTNLPGSPAWSVGNNMVAGDTKIDVIYEPTTPLKSLLANTATTVVCAAGGLAVLGRVNVSYYVGA
jgi:coenzyme F420-reducing hydrogenase delta subunit